MKKDYNLKHFTIEQDYCEAESQVIINEIRTIAKKYLPQTPCGSLPQTPLQWDDMWPTCKTTHIDSQHWFWLKKITALSARGCGKWGVI